MYNVTLLLRCLGMCAYLQSKYTSHMVIFFVHNTSQQHYVSSAEAVDSDSA